MKLNEPYLIINLNDNEIILFVVSYDEKKNYTLIKDLIIKLTNRASSISS